MSKDTSGPAFQAGSIRKARQRPNDPGSDFIVTDIVAPKNEGMALRDYFAAKALQGLLAMEANPAFGDSCEPYRNHCRCDLMAADAYGLADAMLAERAK